MEPFVDQARETVAVLVNAKYLADSARTPGSRIQDFLADWEAKSARLDRSYEMLPDPAFVEVATEFFHLEEKYRKDFFDALRRGRYADVYTLGDSAIHQVQPLYGRLEGAAHRYTYGE